jgi:uncharacterized cofD-like protein
MNVVAIGGGGGAQQVLRGMLAYTRSLAAIIAVTDTGRSTGVARRLVGMPAPGDLRSTISALSLAHDDTLARLLEYRLRTDEVPALDGMAVGNLLLAALTQQTGNFATAVATLQRLVGCAARVLPVATADAQLCAELADGSIVEGELAVRGVGKPPIARLYLAAPAAAHGPALDAIHAADLVVLGPGSLFTTLLASLLFGGVADALHATPGRVVYVCNTTTQPGQTDGFDAVDHVAWLLKLLPPGTLDAVLLNTALPDPADAARYRALGVHPLSIDDAQLSAVAALGPQPVAAALTEAGGQRRELWNKVDTIRHHPAKLARALCAIIGADG